MRSARVPTIIFLDIVPAALVKRPPVLYLLLLGYSLWFLVVCSLGERADDVRFATD